MFTQDLSTIGPRRYESKTVPGKGVGKLKRKLENSQVSSVPKKTRGLVITLSTAIPPLSTRSSCGIMMTSQITPTSLYWGALSNLVRDIGSHHQIYCERHRGSLVRDTGGCHQINCEGHWRVLVRDVGDHQIYCEGHWR